MKRLLSLSLVAVLFGTIPLHTAAHSSFDDDLIQENPDFDESLPKTAEEDKDSVDETLEAGDSKSAIEKALRTSRTLPRRTWKVVRKHRGKVLAGLALLAFRREVKQVLWRMFSERVKDPKTGEVIRRAIPVRPTTILKFALFVHLMLQLQSGSGGNSSPASTLLLAGSRGNPMIAVLLSKLLAPANPAFVPPVEQHYTFERVNERYRKDGLALLKATGGVSSTEGAWKRERTAPISPLFRQTNLKPSYNSTIILMDLTGLDSSLSDMDSIRDEVSFLLSEYREAVLPTEVTADSNATEAVDMEVVILLESPGGSAADYALASQQILRLRNAGLKVTICVDKVAASGGYMIACTSSPGRLFAAPFAVLGSIGVIGQAVNVQKTLEGWGVRPLVFRGGRDKTPVGLIGDVTDEGLAKVQLMVDKTHTAFKRHVSDARPIVAAKIDELATGDVWLGYDALDNKLIDRIVTSDEYIGERLQQGARVLKLVKMVRPKFLFSRPSTASSFKASSAWPANILPSLVGDVQSIVTRFVEALSFVRFS